MSFSESEKKLNKILLNIIIGFSFLADSKYEISDFLKKQIPQIIEHLLSQYKKYKDLYISFKTRHKQHTKHR